MNSYLEKFEKMRIAGNLAARTLDMLTEHIKSGISTKYIDKLGYEFIRDNGGYSAPLFYRGYNKSLCTSLNHVVCHGIPSKKVLDKGDIINIDVTVILDGWHGDTSRMFIVDETTSIKAKKLIMTDHPLVTSGNATKDNLNIHNWIISWLKANFLNPNIITEQKIKNKVYIDRSNTISNHSPQRLISNEDEIKKYLLKNNFIFVKLHETKFREQINLFHNAECIVGLHGAGFVNVVFCKPGTKIIELRSLNTGDTVKNLSKKNDLNYSSIDVEAKETYKFYYPTQHGSIQIPISSLIKTLEN